MNIAPMSTSDRAWLWNVAADVSEGEPEAITVSARLANAESKWHTIDDDTAFPRLT